MIGDVLCLLRDRLNAHLGASLPDAGPDSAEQRVQLIDGEKSDPVEFRLNAITVLLVNIEQDASQRSADPYLRTPGEPSLRKLQPEIRLNLYVLFVARFKVYEQGLNQLSQVIRFLMAHRALDPSNTPGLSPQIEKLVLGLVTLPLSEQNEIWSALRINYHPSVLFRVRMVVFRDAVGTAVPQIDEAVARISQRA